MGMLGDIRADVRDIRQLLEDDDGEERPKLTPEEHARFEEFTRKIRERIAEREAREQEMERRREASG